MKFTSTILTCPGLGSSGPAHWQSIWEMLYGFTRVKQAEWDTPSSDDWVNTLNEYVQRYPPAKVILVGHSLACNTIANWANKFKVPIKAALLVSPSDTEAGSFPPDNTGFQPMPLQRLPFKTVVVASTNDFYVSFQRAEQFADSWGANLINAGELGHINGQSSLGVWQGGLDMLKELDSD